jgi:uroporphyrinogen-III decarboxylase
MNRMKQIRQVISGKPADPGELPVLMLSQEFDARFCGLTYEQYLSSVEKLVETQLRCIREFDYDFAWMHLHDLIEFEPLGVPVRGGDNIVPGSAGHLPATDDMVSGLRIPSGLRSAGQMPLLLGGIRGVGEQLGDDVCVMGRVSAPFSAAIFLFGIEEGMVMTMTEPQLLDRAIAFCEGFCIEVARLQIEAGAHALWVGDCNATSHLISPATFRRFALGPAKRLLQAIREMGCIAWYYPGDDAPDSLTASAEACPDMLNLTYGTDLPTMRMRLGNRLPLSGNLHPIELLERGSHEAIRTGVKRLVSAESGNPFILGSADCVTRDTPASNVRVAIETART